MKFWEVSIGDLNLSPMNLRWVPERHCLLETAESYKRGFWEMFGNGKGAFKAFGKLAAGLYVVCGISDREFYIEYLSEKAQGTAE